MERGGHQGSTLVTALFSCVRFVVDDARGPFLTCAVGAAVEGTIRLDAVADDLASAMRADGGKPVNGALETVKGVARAGRNDLEGQIVVVAAHLAPGHVGTSSLGGEPNDRTGRARLSSAQPVEEAHAQDDRRGHRHEADDEQEKTAEGCHDWHAPLVGGQLVADANFRFHPVKITDPDVPVESRTLHW